MKWEGHRQSDKVEDRRGAPAGSGASPPGRGRLGLGGVVVVLILGWVLGVNPLTLLGLVGGAGEGGGLQAPGAPAPLSGPGRSAGDDRLAAFVGTVLADTEDVWGGEFTAQNVAGSQARGVRYEPPALVLFDERTPTACGPGQAAMGPFYCPADRKVYIDLRFFETLHRQLGAPGDFAQAYVVAHEVGHHLQQLMGVTGRVAQLRGRLSEAQNNALSVRVELQADCLAGVWAHHSQRGKGWLEQGDLQEALQAAARIGDDTLQRGAGRAVVPETFTHGTGEQRMRWFQRGQRQGRVADCNTFDAKAL